MGKKKEVTVGYKYYLGVHFVLCHGEIDGLTHATVDDRLAWYGDSPGGSITINADGLFGGEKKEGGISGIVDVLNGSRTQGQNSYLASKLGSLVPAYRGVASAVLNQTYMGTNPYMKKWAFRVRRIMKKADGSAQWYTAKAAIGQDMNPAHIIYECITDNDWGMGYLASDIDITSFTQAADTLYSEGFGMSILWDKQASISDFVKEVLRHIDASLYVSKATGKFMLYLMRAGYNPATLKVFDETNIVQVEDYTCSTFTELANSVTVNYWDSSTGKNSSLTVQDIALVQLQGAIVESTMEYGGCTTGALAARLASRDLKALSTPITRCTVTATRTAAQVVPGEPVKLTWPDYGVTDMIMRVAAIDFGTATDNSVKLTLIQDVFALGTATYAAPAPTSWVPIINTPQPATNRTLMEAPYYTLVKNFGETEINNRMVDLPTIGYVLSAAARPTGDSIAADLWTDAGAGYASEVGMDFCAMGVCTSIVSPTATSAALTTTQDFYVDMIQTGRYAAINSELVEITGFTSTTISFKRGVLDTVPAQHAAGSKIYMLQSHNALGTIEYVSGETINTRILPITGKGMLALGSAPTSSITMVQRANRPYPPGAWSICGSQFPTTVINMPLVSAWAHRDRLQQTGDNLVDFSEGSIGPEAGTSYSLRLYNNDTSALLHSTDGVAGTTYSGFPSLSGTYNLRMEVWSVRGGLASYQKQSHVFYYENIYHLTLEDASGHLITEGSNTLITE